MVHHILTALAGVLGSVPAAIVVATILLRALLLPLSLRGYRAEGVRARLAPRLAELQQRHGKEPAVLLQQQTELLRAEGSGPFAGLLPALAQAPFVWLLYREFTNGAMHGHTLLGADLTGRLINQPGLLAGWLIVGALAAVAVWTVRRLPAGTPGSCASCRSEPYCSPRSCRSRPESTCSPPRSGRPSSGGRPGVCWWSRIGHRRPIRADFSTRGRKFF